MFHIELRFPSIDKVLEKDTVSIYNTSIRDQFEFLQIRYPFFHQYDNLDEFLADMNNFDRIYQISLPNFERQFESRNNRHYLNNVVIRTVLEEQVSIYKKNYVNFMFIGTITFIENNDTAHFEVKGIDVLDNNVGAVGEKQFTAMAWIKAGSINLRPSMSSDNILSKEFVDDLVAYYYTVKNVNTVRDTYVNWNRYLDFVSDFLQKQKRENYPISDIQRLDTYAISKQEFIERNSECEPLVLDKDVTDRFRKRDEIVLTTKVGEAYEFPLIRVAVDRLKKLFTGDFDRSVSAYKKTISRFSNENVSATSKLPETLDEKEYSIVVSNGLQLGDRYAMLDPIEIEPDYREIDLQTQQQKKKAATQIQARFSDAKKAYVNREEQKFREKLTDDMNDEMLAFELSLDPEDKELDLHMKRKRSALNNNLEKRLTAHINQIRTEYEIQHKEEMEIEIARQEEQIDTEGHRLREQLRIDQTILRIYLYFRPENSYDNLYDDLKYLMYDDTASRKKIQRARDALKQFYKGNVKNPFLANYLFDPASLVPAANIDEDLEWFITRLNPEQKTAVKRAFRSNGLFTARASRHRKNRSNRRNGSSIY
jgi:hypothetical protein